MIPRCSCALTFGADDWISVIQGSLCSGLCISDAWISVQDLTSCVVFITKGCLHLSKFNCKKAPMEGEDLWRARGDGRLEGWGYLRNVSDLDWPNETFSQESLL